MKGGKKYGLLEDSEDLWKKTQRAYARLRGPERSRPYPASGLSNNCKRRDGKGKGGQKKSKCLTIDRSLAFAEFA
jgi:hypothetical protein